MFIKPRYLDSDLPDISISMFGKEYNDPRDGEFFAPHGAKNVAETEVGFFSHLQIRKS